MLGSTRLVNRARQVGVRRMGGWIRTHVRTEENAGLREASYKTWEFDTTSVPRLLVYMFIPGTLFFFMAKEEMVSSDASFWVSEAILFFIEAFSNLYFAPSVCLIV